MQTFDYVYMLFMGSLAVWLLFEAFLVYRDRGKAGDRDKGTRRTMLLLLAAAIASGVYFSGSDLLLIPGDRVLQMALGIGLIWLGMLLRLWAITILGRFFTTVVSVQAGQKVIRSGPYKYVRHPSYTGSLVSFIGFGLALGNLLGLLVVYALVFSAYVIRIRVEEEVLSSSFGDEYKAYVEKTKRLIPLIY